MSLSWGKLYVSQNELKLENVLQAGQAFRWVRDENSGEYLSTMKIMGNDSYSVIALRQNNDKYIEFTSYDNNCSMPDLLAHLKRYFRLEVEVNDLFCKEWFPKDPNFRNISGHGIRILSQEPWETLISFICSTNNNISRITRMCHALCTNYGREIGSFNSTTFYSFPSSDELTENATEADLRDLGFGYRAKYIIGTAKRMVENRTKTNYLTDTEYLTDISKTMNYQELREYLMGYSGIGPKVADCICLMGMRMDHVVPVDVHVERIASRDYKIKASNKDIVKLKERYRELPITRKKIDLQLDYIRLKLTEKWGDYAGWAQGILFFREVGGTSGANTDGQIKKRKHNQLEKLPELKTVSSEHIQMKKIPKIKTE